MAKSNTITTTCFHCGSDCKDDEIVFDEKPFCCSGCKNVYQLLNENGLCTYYELDDNRKPNKEEISSSKGYSFLDEPSIRKEIVDYEDEKIARVELSIPSIHCSSCVWLLEKIDTLLNGVISSQVNFSRKTVYVIYRVEDTSLREVCNVLAKLGYPPVIQKKGNQEKEKYNLAKKLWLQIGVTGFCTGNIMLLSFPEYFQLEGIADGITDTFFRNLNVLLAFPVVFFGGKDYFRSAWASILTKKINLDVPLALGISVLFLRSLYDIYFLNQSGYLDSLAGLVFFLLLGKWLQQKVYDNLSFDRDIKSFLPLSVQKLEEGSWKDVLVSTLKIGDHLRILNGGLLPVDSVLLSKDAKGDLSFITGESEPVAYSKGAYLYAGTKNASTLMEVLVQKEVDQSYLSRLWESADTEKKGQQLNFADQVSRYFVWITLGIALLASIYWFFNGPDKIWHVISSVLIVACPCALSLSSPFMFGTGIALLGKKGFYLKNPDVLQRMAHIQAILFDKTGTLSEKKGIKTTYKGKQLTQSEINALFSLASQSPHPMSRAISDYIIDKFPETKLSEVKHFLEYKGIGIEGLVEGGYILIGKKEFAGCIQDETETHDLGSVYINCNGEYKGYFICEKSFRNGLKEMAEGLVNMGLSTSVVSGDNSREKPYLEKILPVNTGYLFEAQPHEKKEIVEGTQKRGCKVMMLGDGLNDAAALRAANVGLAITDSLSSFSPASDGILLGASLSKLHDYVKYSKKLWQGLMFAFFISLSYNIVGMSFAVSGLLSPLVSAILMPLSSITVVAFVTSWAKFFGKDLK